MGEKRNSYRLLVGKSEGKRLLRRLKSRWENNIKMNLRYDEVVWTGFIYLRTETGGQLL
jgi:hypothetical protein